MLNFYQATAILGYNNRSSQAGTGGTLEYINVHLSIGYAKYWNQQNMPTLLPTSVNPRNVIISYNGTNHLGFKGCT